MPMFNRFAVCLIVLISLSWRSGTYGFLNAGRPPRTVLGHELKAHMNNKHLSRHSNHPTSLQMSTISTLASAVSVAGVIAFHEAGHFLAAKWQGMKVQSFNIGYGPKIVSFNDSADTEFNLRAVPLGGYVSFPMNVELDEETGEVVKELDDPDLLQNRPPLQRALVISAGVLANILLTFLISFGVSFNYGMSTPTYDNGIVVTTLQDTNAPAYKAGLRVDDIITKLNGVPLQGSETTVENFITTVRRSENQPLDLEVLRYDKPKPDSVASLRSKTAASATIQSTTERTKLQTKVTPVTNTKGRVSIGLGINAIVKDVKVVKAQNPADAIRLGVEQTGKLTVFTYSALVRAVSTGFAGSDVGGPISVVTAGAAMADYSPSALLGFIASLSINLAVINALPFPALDGGQLTFVLAELISRKKVPRRAQEIINALAFSMLFAFSLSTIVGDIDKLTDSAATATQAKVGTVTTTPAP